MGTQTFIAIVTGAAFACLAIVSLNGITENLVACWPLAAVVSAGLIALGIAHRHRPEKYPPSSPFLKRGARGILARVKK